MTERQTADTVFLTVLPTAAWEPQARLMIESLRWSAGALADAPVWLFIPTGVGLDSEARAGFEQMNVVIHPLTPAPEIAGYPFASKVTACARAEPLAAKLGVRSLVWVSSDCLFIQAPVLLDLAPTVDVALRPVHHRNIGLPADAPVDAFWGRVYAAAGVEEVDMTVETFVESEPIRAYFNSHLLSIDPARGFWRRWLTTFTDLVTDDDFQGSACADPPHRIFLHQAILSALLTMELGPERMQVLPAAYSYPYDLHREVPERRRPHALNELVCVTTEGRSMRPDDIEDLVVHEPLLSWLEEHAPAEGP